jgi:glycosyltransferase involved in cell wall biosynthesis
MAGATYYPSVNGQAIFSVNLAQGLAARGNKVLFITQSHFGKPYRCDHKGVRVQALRAYSLSLWYPGARLTPFPGREVQEALCSFQPDIVHIQDHYPISQHVYKLSRRYNRKVVGTNHFMPENLAPYLQSIAWFKTGYRKILWRWMLDLYNQLDMVTGPSQTAARILQNQGLTTPVEAVSCGVDLERFYPDSSLDRRSWRRRFDLDEQSTLFVFVGRVDGEKRLDLLLQAMQLLRRDDLQLAIAGKGAALNGLKRQAAELGLLSNVRFLGYVPDQDLPGLLNSADIFIMPSEAELLSIATLEAMACGKPVLAARAQALPELVTPYKNGYLFHAGDAQEAANFMALLADRPKRWPEMAAASLEKVQPHSLENTLKRYEEIYQSVLGQPSLPDFQMGSASLHAA